MVSGPGPDDDGVPRAAAPGRAAGGVASERTAGPAHTPWRPWSGGAGERCAPLAGRPDVVVHRAAASAPDAAALRGLDAAERARAERFLRAADRARFVTARLVARAALSERLGVAATDVPLGVAPTVGSPVPQRGGTGRPVVGAVAGRHAVVSIAHAGDVVLVALASVGRIGVDVERRPGVGTIDAEGGPGVPAIATRDLWDVAAGGTERRVLEALPVGERDDAFLALWTRKEAVLKACGRGLTVPMTELEVTLGDDARLFRAPEAVGAPARTTVVDLDVGAGYRAALAVGAG